MNRGKFNDGSGKIPGKFDAFSIIKNDNLEIIRLQLKPGEVIEKHRNHARIVFYVLSGSGILKTNDSEKLLLKNAYYVTTVWNLGS